MPQNLQKAEEQSTRITRRKGGLDWGLSCENILSFHEMVRDRDRDRVRVRDRV